MRRIWVGLFMPILFLANHSAAQRPLDQSQWGAWYMYIYNAPFQQDGAWGVKGDVQFRNFNLMGDMNQLLIRSGFSYARPAVRYTLGFAHITNSGFDSDSITAIEHRVYQEAVIPHRLSERLALTHRFRVEQRWIGEQALRGRIRYHLSATIPLHKDRRGRWYLNFYDELFINARLGTSAALHYFDRNRLYGAAGYRVSSKLKLQLGVMNRITSDFSVNQWQLSVNQSF